MTIERKADVEGALAELKFELELAISQGRLKNGLKWSQALNNGPGHVGDPYIVILTVYPVRGGNEVAKAA